METNESKKKGRRERLGTKLIRPRWKPKQEVQQKGHILMFLKIVTFTYFA